MEIPLIKFVENNGCLYDPRNEFYRNTRIKEEKWIEISKEFKMPVEKVKQRWKSLRDSYNRKKKHIAKIKNSDRYGRIQKDWKYFDLLHFLDDIPERNISSQFFKEKTTNMTKIEEDDVPLGWEKDDTASSTCFSESKIPFVEEFVQSFEAGTIPDEYHDEEKTIPDEEKTIEDTEDSLELVEEKNCIKQENVDVLFGRMLSAYIKTLSRVNNMKVKREIFEVLAKYIEKEEEVKNNKDC